MSLRKLIVFMLAATLANSATVGTLNVQIHEYEVPTPKSRPHDPAVAWCATWSQLVRGSCIWLAAE